MKLDYCAVHSGALIAPGSEPNCLFIRYDDGRIMTSKEVWAEIERLRAEILRLKRADDEATRLAITCSDLRAERAALRELLREANTHMRYHNIAEGLREMIDAALGKEKP